LTRYMRVLLQLDDIPSLQDFLTGFFTWILPAGYMVFPGTFTSLGHSKTVQDAAGKTVRTALHRTQHLCLRQGRSTSLPHVEITKWSRNGGAEKMEMTVVEGGRKKQEGRRGEGAKGRRVLM